MQFRHGDLLIESVNAIPEAAVLKEDNIIAYGTATGHSHALADGGVVLAQDNDIYLDIPGSGGAVTHEEHNTIALPGGKYRVIRQVEYNPYERATRMVMD